MNDLSRNPSIWFTTVACEGEQRKLVSSSHDHLINIKLLPQISWSNKGLLWNVTPLFRDFYKQRTLCGHSRDGFSNIVLHTPDNGRWEQSSTQKQNLNFLVVSSHQILHSKSLISTLIDIMHYLLLLLSLVVSTQASTLSNKFTRRQPDVGLPGGVYTCTEDHFRGKRFILDYTHRMLLTR